MQVKMYTCKGNSQQDNAIDELLSKQRARERERKGDILLFFSSFSSSSLILAASRMSWWSTPSDWTWRSTASLCEGSRREREKTKETLKSKGEEKKVKKKRRHAASGVCCHFNRLRHVNNCSVTSKAKRFIHVLLLIGVKKVVLSVNCTFFLNPFAQREYSELVKNEPFSSRFVERF